MPRVEKSLNFQTNLSPHVTIFNLEGRVLVRAWDKAEVHAVYATSSPRVTFEADPVPAAGSTDRLRLVTHAQDPMLTGQDIAPAGPHPLWIQLLTSMFLHAGWLHLIGNMVYLWIFGDNVEDRLGHALFTVFYLLCGLGATFAQLFFSLGSDVPNLGASGAIAGVLGAYLIMFPSQRIRVMMGYAVIPMPALIVIGFWIVLQVFSQVSAFTASSQTGGGVAYMAHIGGFIAGVVLAFVLGGTRGIALPPGSYR